MHSVRFAALYSLLVLAAPAIAGGTNDHHHNSASTPGKISLNKRQNAQDSLTLLKELVQPASAKTGQEDATAGQVDSATSSNNFINFCAQFPDVALTNGEQIQEGSCNGIPLGRIPPKNKTPAAMIQFPQNNAVVPFGDITFRIKTSNLQTGAFTNAQLTYYAAPVSLNNDNVVIGHSHITCQLLPSLNSVDLLDINVFAFFKGLNDPADANGELTATAAAKDANGKITGLKPGPYRCCTINSGSNHLPIVPAFAQRGNVDDCVRFTVSDDLAASGNDGNANNANNATAGGADNGDNGNTADAGNTGTANTGNAKGQWRDKGRKQNQGQKRSNNVQPKEDGRRSFSPRGRSRIMRDIILH